MTVNKKKMNKNSLIHVSTVVALTIALVTSTFAFSMGTIISGTPLNGNDPPYVPHHPGPGDGAVNVSIYQDLNWTGGDPDGNNVTYDIYFGNVSPPPQVWSNWSYEFFDPGDIGGMNYSTTYYWLIIAWDNESNSAQGPQWSFSTKDNLPPNTPSNPYPTNGSTNISIDVSLNWTGGDPDNDPVIYEVYFGNMSPPPKVAENLTDENYDPDSMNYSTHYYWMIVAWDNQNTSATGPVWEFTTGEKPNFPPYTPSNPNPTNGATNVPLTQTLSWTGGDPDENPVLYDVYFGTTSPPPIATNNQSGETFDPVVLNYGTKYYWKIVAWDNYSASSEGPSWSFTTIQGSEIEVNIIKPLEGTLYFQDRELISLFNNTIVYGPITITAEVQSDSAVTKVEFYIDGTLEATVEAAPYNYTWNPIIQFNGLSLKHSIKVVAYNENGKSASDELNVTKWRFHILPWVVAGMMIASGLILHTKITGWVYNLQESRFSCSFFVVSAFYKTTGPLRSARGVIKRKAVTGGKIIGFPSLIKFGPFHKLAFGSFTFIGVPHVASRGRLLGNLLPLRQTSSNSGGFFRNLLTR